MQQETEQPEAPVADEPSSVSEPFLAVEARLAQIGIFVILLVGGLYFSKDYAMPVALAFIMALVLSPVIKRLHRAGIPEGLAAGALILTLIVTLTGSVWLLATPVGKWVSDAPEIAFELRNKIHVLRQPVDQVVEASKRIEDSASASSNNLQKVVVAEPGLLSRAATGLPEIGAKMALFVVLLFFLLASGDMFYEKLVKVLPTLSDKKRGIRIAREVEREISTYLFTITVINIGLGLVLSGAMWILGLPSPFVFGLLGGILNYLPFLGALVSAAIVAAVAFVTFDTLHQMLLPPVLFFLINTIEGQLITPALIGRRLELNPVAVFIAVAFWGWLWGIVGAIMAVPILVIVKIIADHIESYRPIGEFLAARNTDDE